VPALSRRRSPERRLSQISPLVTGLGAAPQRPNGGAPGTMLLRNGCPISDSTTQGMSNFDAVFSQATESLLEFSVLVFLSGCEAKPECDSFETRNAVLQTVTNDHKNPLVEYAAKSRI
jgi:hypothetical protein